MRMLLCSRLPQRHNNVSSANLKAVMANTKLMEMIVARYYVNQQAALICGNFTT